MAQLTLKNEMNTWDLDPTVNMNARKVLNPPFKTAGPISVNVLRILSALLPEQDRKYQIKHILICIVCTEHCLLCITYCALCTVHYVLCNVYRNILQKKFDGF